MRAALPPARWQGLLPSVLALCLLLSPLATTPGQAASTAPALGEAQLRARFILNFLRFTDWPVRVPEGSTDPVATTVQLCVLSAHDPFDGALGELQGVVASGRRIQVRGLVEVEQLAGCNALYVPDSDLRRLPAAREAAGHAPLLIIGESEQALDRGALIGMRMVERHLGFVVRIGAMRRMNLNFSPQMLNAAAEVLP